MDNCLNTSTGNDVMVNPLLKNKMEIQSDENTIELSLVNLPKYFHKIYILCPFKNEPIDGDIYSRNIERSKWNSFSGKFIRIDSKVNDT